MSDQVAKQVWWKRVTSRRKLPGWVWFLLGLITRVPDWAGRYDFWRETANRIGGNLGMIPSIVGSPYFSFGLMLVGVLYLIFVGEPQKGVQRHPWWPYIGWVSAGLFGLIVFSALEAGVISSFLIVERHLKPKNYQRIVEAAHKSANHFKRPIAVAAISTPEADAFAIEIMQALKEGGLPIFSISREVLIPNSMIALGTNVKGIFIQVFNVSNPPEEALILKGILENGKLNVGFYRNFDYGDLNYLLTIGLP